VYDTPVIGRFLRRLLGPVSTDSSEFEADRAILNASTHSVVLRLDPAALPDPDLEVRREIERMLKAASPSVPFVEDGYGFARHSEAMLLSYATSEPDRLVEAIVRMLDEDTVLGNRLGPAAMVGVGPRNPNCAAGREFEEHQLVYPSSEAGKPVPD
jgi:hypothetical protein